MKPITEHLNRHLNYLKDKKNRKRIKGKNTKGP